MQEVRGSSSSRMARKACMRLLEQLERTPSAGFAQQPSVDVRSQGSSPLYIALAPLPLLGSEGVSDQSDSQQESFRLHNDSQRGSTQEHGSSFAESQDCQQVPGSIFSHQSSDIAAMAALTVQVFTRQMHYRPAADTGYWRSQVPKVPAAAQQFVLACLADRPASVQKLMKDSFFTAEVRAAASYLHSLEAAVDQQQAAETHQQSLNLEERAQTGSGHYSALQAMLDGNLNLRALAKRGALRLCMPSIIRVVMHAAMADSPSDASALQQGALPPQSKGALVAEALLRLIVLSARSLAIQGPLQVWAALLGSRAPSGLPASPGEGAVQAEAQAELMQAACLRQLVAGVGLSAYLDTVHSALLSAVCGGVSDAGEPAAAQVTQHAVQARADLPESASPSHTSPAAHSCWSVMPRLPRLLLPNGHKVLH